jgi:hypothetical protein
MADHAHDVNPVFLVVEGVAHGVAVDRQTVVVLAEDLIPALSGSVEVERIDADEDIAQDVFAGDEIASVLTAAAEGAAKATFAIGSARVLWE